MIDTIPWQDRVKSFFTATIKISCDISGDLLTGLNRYRYSSAMVFSCFFVFLLFVRNVHVLNNGLALTPPMGWMSWGYYECKVDCEKFPDRCLNEELILSVADAFYNEGYQEAGYEYIIIDDCWSEKIRENGRLVPDRQRFPRGMAYIADYIHKKGLKFGMYTNIAHITCMGYPGSKDHFRVDAQTFADWGVDYIKVDGCFVGEKDLNKAYIEFGQHLNETGRPMVYSCSWPYYIQYIIHKKPDFAPIAHHCNMWRNYHDVKTAWIAISYIIQHFQKEYDVLQKYHGPGHWNDPDMLILGQGELSESKSRAHLSVHAMMSAPLLLSCDMNKIQDFEKKLLLNLDLIALAQDPMGIMARPYQLDTSLTLYVKPHYPKKGDIYPSYSFLLLNLDTNPYHSISFVPAKYGINSTDGYSVMDVYTGIYLQNITLKDSINVSVVEDSVMFTLFPL